MVSGFSSRYVGVRALNIYGTGSEGRGRRRAWGQQKLS